jgi:hypothetical protein
MTKDKPTPKGEPVEAWAESAWPALALPPEAIPATAHVLAETDPEAYGKIDYMAHCCAAFRVFEERHGRRPQLGPELDAWVQDNLDFLRRLEPTGDDYARATEALEILETAKAARRNFLAAYGREAKTLEEIVAWADCPPAVREMAAEALLRQAPRGAA